MSANPSPPSPLVRRAVGDNLWLARAGSAFSDPEWLAGHPVFDIEPDVQPSEEAVGRAMLEELEMVARSKGDDEPVTIALLGGRGGQALHRLLGERARAGDPDGLISRLHVFTQDALAPLPMDSPFSFVRDFERLLGEAFFARVRSFTPLRTDVADLEAEVRGYIEKLDAAGGLDIFFLGHGPEPGEASHLAYIKPNSGAAASDVAGVIPISESILEHHIKKFRAGGTDAGADAEAACRRASHILTLGPAAILTARRLVQSIVDADTAPAKRVTYRRVRETGLSEDGAERARQLDENPGLWLRLHPSVRSLVLPNVPVAADS